MSELPDVCRHFITLLPWSAPSLKFMVLRSIDILLASAELKQAWLCIQLGRMLSPHKNAPSLTQWSLHPLRFPRYRGTETHKINNPSSCVALVPHIPAFCEVLHAVKRKTLKTSTRPFAPRPLLAMGRSTDDARSILLS